MGISGIGPVQSLFDYLMPSAADKRADAASMLTDSTVSSSGDSLDISAEGAAASQSLADELLIGETSRSKSTTLTDLEQAQQEAQGVISAKLKRLFKENGIDTSTEFRLQVAGDGSVICVGDHPQKAEIEQLFKDDPELRNQFAHFQSLTEFVASAHESLAFQKAYAKDPRAAVAEFGYLFNSSVKGGAYLSFDGDAIDAVYERGSHREVLGKEE